MFERTRMHVVESPAGLRLHFRAGPQWTPLKNRPEITFRNEDDGALLQLTPWPREAAPQVRANMRSGFVATVENARANSVPGSVVTGELGGGNGLEGYYYHAEDPSPKIGEWRYMMSGIFADGEFVFSFTILANRAMPEGAREAMQLIEYMKIEPLS